MIYQNNLSIDTSGREIIDITEKIRDCVAQTQIDKGLCHVFIHHTSASLILCENADPLVQRDLEAFIQRLIPDGDAIFQHRAEGPDDMPAHIRNILTSSFLMIPIKNKKLDLGVWQGVYLWEHRLRPNKRKITVSVF